MTALISLDMLGQLLSSERALDWFDPLNQAAEAYKINTKERIGAWLGQLLHESGEFKYIEESLNYSAQSLLKVFPKYFNADRANIYARRPQAIANRVYANRMGNSDESSNDGWRYRGRGLVQLTGKSNYQAVSTALKIDFVKDPDSLTEPLWAAMSAGWFWNSHGCNALADKSDTLAITRTINGGTNGLDSRIAYTKKVLALLAKMPVAA
jgi:putative chitinase